MSRKNRQKHRKPTPGAVSARVKKTATSQPIATSDTSAKVPPQKKIMVNAMDVFRAIDSASKTAIAVATADGFDNFLSRIGLNNDNALSDSTYVFNLVTRNRVLLEAAYRGSWIVGSVIDSVAEDMTRAGVEIDTSEGVDLEPMHKTMTRLQIWQSLANTIKWGRLYGGALGVMQIQGQKLDTPLDVDTVAKGQFKGIAVYDRWMLNPVMTPVINSGPEVGLPVFYQLTETPQAYDPQASPMTGQITVHHSRCVRYTGIDLPFFQAITEMMWGESILERLWDRLIAFDNATMSTASLIDRANLRTVGIEGLREIIAAGGEAQAGLEKMFDMMRLMQVNEGLTLIDKNDTFATTSYSFAGLPETLLQFGQQLSGASGIPLRRLFGQAPVGLGGDGDADIRMYYDNINAQQEARLRDPLSVLLKVMWRSVYGVPEPKDLDFSFTPLWQMSAADKAMVGKTHTETVIGAHEAGLVSVGTAMKELRDFSGNTGLFSNISEEDIAEAEAEEPPLPDEAPAQETEKPTEEEPKEPVKNLDTAPSWIKRIFSVDAGKFKESDHPRKENGEFGNGGGSQKKGSDPAEEKEKKPEVYKMVGSAPTIEKLKSGAEKYFGTKVDFKANEDGTYSVFTKGERMQNADLPVPILGPNQTVENKNGWNIIRYEHRHESAIVREKNGRFRLEILSPDRS